MGNKFWIAFLIVFGLPQLILASNYRATIPQIAVGGGYETEVFIKCRGRQAFNGVAQFFTGSNQQMTLDVNGSQVQGQYPFTISGGATQSLLLTSNSSTVRAGALLIMDSDPDGTPEIQAQIEVNAIYRIRNGGVITDTIGVLAAKAIENFTMPVDRRFGRDQGLALFNYGFGDGSPTTAEFRLIDPSGATVDTKQETLQHFEHRAFFLSQLLTIPDDFTGRVEVRTGETSLLATALDFDSGQFSAIPVLPIADFFDLVITFTSRVVRTIMVLTEEDFTFTGELKIYQDSGAPGPLDARFSCAGGESEGGPFFACNEDSDGGFVTLLIFPTVGTPAAFIGVVMLMDSSGLQDTGTVVGTRT